MTGRRVALGLLTALAGGVGCHGGADQPGRPSEDVEVPGIDTRDFTPREKHEFSRYLRELPSPCASVAVPLADCVIERRACPACLVAAEAVAKAVREGLSTEQVEDIYKKRFDAKSAKDIPVDGSPSRGPEGATVTIVEFADFECPACQRIAPELDDLWQKHKDAVRFVYKFMPLPMHPHGEIAARAAIAAQAQGKFWEMDRQLFANGSRLTESDLDTYAKAIGLDLDRFHADSAAAATKVRIDTDRKLADDLGVKGTPTLFINGREYDAKIDIDEWVDREIAESRAR
jgi:protein-disulfide isomerase